MHAMILDTPHQPLQLQEVPVAQPGPNQVLLYVQACAVCHTDLHIVDGELSEPKLPLILGHQIVGTVVEMGTRVERFELGERVGVPWLGYTDGTCRSCRRGQENLCDNARFTVRSVANLTRQDGVDFLEIAPQVPVQTTVHRFPLEAANEALDQLRGGQIEGAAVLQVKRDE
jgi:D-arabinose 1-dehydrogenase-like Zn-dependent alcohol dehydrogenase